MPDLGVLLLRLEGPLQSWGERSRWDVRDTALRPTKSGVVGMLACAFGYRRNDARIVALQEGVTFGVRVDRAGTFMEDFQTISGALPAADGTSKGSMAAPYTIISRRAYLQDASFLIGLHGDLDVLGSCEAALQRPVWAYYLGRKSCPPSRPVVVGVREGLTLVEALAEICPDGVEGRAYDSSASVYVETPGGEVAVRDKNLGRPARDYSLTRYDQHSLQGTSGVSH